MIFINLNYLQSTTTSHEIAGAFVSEVWVVEDDRRLVIADGVEKQKPNLKQWIPLNLDFWTVNSVHCGLWEPECEGCELWTYDVNTDQRSLYPVPVSLMRTS